MAKAVVYYQAIASVPVEVEVPDDFDENAEEMSREDKARELAEGIADMPVTLCWHCSSRIDLGDFEPDDSPHGVEFLS